MRFGRRTRAVLVALGLVAAPLALVVVLAGPAAAASFSVDNTGDPAVGNAANCPAVPTGTCTLRDAIAAADAVAGDDTITLAVGPISLTQGVLAHSTADALIIVGNGNTVTQTTAAGLLDTNGPLTVSDITTTGGNTVFDAAGPVSVTGSSLSTTNGNGIVSFVSSATVVDTTINASLSAVNATQDATVSGSTLTSTGGVAVLAANGNASVTGSSATGAGAGVVAGVDATVTNSTIGSGLGVGVLAGGTASVTGSGVTGAAGGVQGSNATVASSSISSSGGIGVLATVGSVVVTDSTVTGATLAIVAVTGATVSGSTITGGPSGAVLTLNGSADITSSTVTGGGQFGVSAPDNITIVNSTVTGNGGCGALAPNGTVTLVYATVVENGAVHCGANISAGTLESFASVVALHSPNCIVGTTISHGYNFADDGTCGFGDATDRPNGGNPLLGPLTNNGGPTPTRLPQPGSPLIDGVALASCSADGAASINPLVDQRSVSRPQGPGCDIGAVEVVVLPPTAAAPAVLITPRFTG